VREERRGTCQYKRFEGGGGDVLIVVTHATKLNFFTHGKMICVSSSGTFKTTKNQNQVFFIIICQGKTKQKKSKQNEVKTY
jgi:hypothetical protein